MPIVRTPYDLGPGGRSIPDHDAQARQAAKAMQAQILGMALEQQRFMTQMTFNQRQKSWENAMREKQFAANQADAGKMSEKEKASLALAKEEMAFKKTKYQSETESKAEQNRLTGEFRTKQLDMGAAAQAAQIAAQGQTALYRQTTKEAADTERTAARTAREQSLSLQEGEKTWSREQAALAETRRAEKELRDAEIRGEETKIRAAKTKLIELQTEQALRDKEAGKISVRGDISEEFDVPPGQKLPWQQVRGMAELGGDYGKADETDRRRYFTEIMQIFGPEIKKIAGSKGKQTFSLSEWKIFEEKAKSYVGDDPEKAKWLKEFILMQIQKIPLSTEDPNARGSFPGSGVMQAAGEWMSDDYSKLMEQQRVKNIQGSSTRRNALQQTILKNLFGQNTP